MYEQGLMVKITNPEVLAFIRADKADESNTRVVETALCRKLGIPPRMSGQDDLSILQELYASLKDLGMKAYSGIDEKALFAYKSLDFSGISEQDITLNEVNFMFCDINYAAVEKVLDSLENRPLDPEKDALVVGDIDRFIGLMTRVKKKLSIKNRSVALLAMCRICEAYLEATGEEEQAAKPTQ